MTMALIIIYSILNSLEWIITLNKITKEYLILICQIKIFNSNLNIINLILIFSKTIIQIIFNHYNLLNLINNIIKVIFINNHNLIIKMIIQSTLWILSFNNSLTILIITRITNIPTFIIIIIFNNHFNKAIGVSLIAILTLLIMPIEIVMDNIKEIMIIYSNNNNRLMIDKVNK